MKLAKVDDTLSRDLNSNAVINTSITAFEEFKLRKLQERESSDRITNLERRLERIEDMLSSLSKMLPREDK